MKCDDAYTVVTSIGTIEISSTKQSVPFVL